MENLGEFIVNHWLLVTLFVVLSSMILSGSLNSKLSGVKPATPSQAIQLVNQQKGLFLDIREASVFTKEHIVDSVNMPLSKVPEATLKPKKTGQPVVLVYETGQQFSAVVKKLRNEGFVDVYALKGGLISWREARLPLFSQKDA